MSKQNELTEATARHAAAVTEHEQARQALSAAREARRAAIAAGDVTARSLDALDAAIIGAGRQCEIAEARLAQAKAARAEAQSAHEQAETERLKVERGRLIESCNEAIAAIEDHVQQGRQAVESYKAAYEALARFDQQHGQRLRLQASGSPADVRIELTLPGWGAQRTQVGTLGRIH